MAFGSVRYSTSTNIISIRKQSFFHSCQDQPDSYTNIALQHKIIDQYAITMFFKKMGEVDLDLNFRSENEVRFIKSGAKLQTIFEESIPESVWSLVRWVLLVLVDSVDCDTWVIFRVL